MIKSKRKLSLLQASKDTVLAELLSQSPGLLWTTDCELNLTALRGAVVPELPDGVGLGQPVQLMFAPHSAFGPLRAHQRALLGESCDFAFSCAGRDMIARIAPLFDREGECAGTIGMAQDSTERMLGERALRISEQSYRSLIEEIPYAICRASRSGQLLQVNQAMLEMLGYDRDSEAELLLRDLPEDIFSRGGFADFLRTLLDERSLQGYECVWRTRMGTEIDVALGGRVLQIHGEFDCLDLLAENITERKRAESNLRQAQKMQSIGQVAGGIAHDFNNLLMVITGQVDMMLASKLDAVSQERLDEIRFASERASALTRQLLTFSRRQVLQSQVLDLNQLIGRMSQMLARLIGEHIELSFIPATQPVFIRADASQIEQVVMNLVVNGRDAMPDGGRLTLTVEQVRSEAGAAPPVAGVEPGAYLRITVRDTGCGMDRETQSRMFEPFFTTKAAGGGTGLGLSTVYGIVRQSNGHIAVESAPGEGATISVYLPEVEQPMPKNAPEDRAATPGRGHETILYAEDNPNVREMMCQFLLGHGYSVLCASDGSNALELARMHAGPIDLLLTDLMMPKIGGLELAEELRKARPGLRVIFASGHADMLLEEDALARHGAVFLAKPFALQSLAESIRNLLDEARV